MRIAYADPPYPGQAKRHYGNHVDYAGEVDHAKLVKRLMGYDAWALSTGSRMLQRVLSLCPANVRLLCWVKPLAPPLADGFMYSWEPVITFGGRPPSPPIRDCLRASPEGFTFRARPEAQVIGAKPPAFCEWLFACLGLQPNDEFDDLFPGSGGVMEIWEKWRCSPRLEVAR